MTQQDEIIAGVCDANGDGALRFRTIGRAEYAVRQVSHNGTISGATAVGASAVAGLYKNGHLIAPTVAQGGVISGEPPVMIRGQDVMELRYSAANAGAGIEMMVIYDDGLPG